jgi:hypothetical protein
MHTIVAEGEMARMARKNLLVDAEKLGDLARRRGTSESGAVRDAVEYALAADEVMSAIRELNASGGIRDVFGRLPDEGEVTPTVASR